MNTSELLLVLHKRAKLIHDKRKYEYLQLQKLKYKSRRVRLSSPLHNRIGWLTDRLQETQLVIRLLEGKCTAEEFIHHKIDDVHGFLATTIGNITGQ